MDETRTIAAALPTAADDQQTQSHGRAARPTAIKLVEDMMPRELFIAHVMMMSESAPPTAPTRRRGAKIS